ncbi:MAG: GGDEF domain-containing protein [Gammaproteobacteria bacterium]|nr:GGDEF domain-containing protein [Gammaproteobacteria bacterium]
MHIRAEWERLPNEDSVGFWPKPNCVAVAPFDKERLLRLTQHLQTTLDVEELIRVYAAEAADVIPFTQVSYSNPEHDLRVEYGRRARHYCTYDLAILDQDLGVLTYTRSRPFSDADTQRLELLTGHLLFPLRNALLYHQAVAAAAKDPLTLVNNRAALDETLDREISLAQRHGTPLTVLMIDLDHFKAVNDRYGHVVGDHVLKAFVARVAESYRASDIFFRYGGEEFTLVLRNTELAGATCLAERIRESVQSRPMTTDAGPVSLTVSIGVAELVNRDHAAFLLARADAALYTSKAQGRNRVTATR